MQEKVKKSVIKGTMNFFLKKNVLYLGENRVIKKQIFLDGKNYCDDNK